MSNNIKPDIISIYEGGDGNVQIYLDNPPVNAFSMKLVEELYNALFDISKNKDFKFLTIYTRGNNFSAGADLKERASMSEQETLVFLDKLNNCFDLLENLEIPTIAVIKGAVLGGGAELALCCDIVAADVRQEEGNVKIGFPETTLGIIPGAGGTYRINKKMDPGAAKYWILSGRTFSAEEAFSYGFIDMIIDTNTRDSDWDQLCNSLISNSRTSLIAAKKSMNKCYLETDRKKQRLIELEEYKKTLNSPERKEALRKYGKK